MAQTPALGKTFLPEQGQAIDIVGGNVGIKLVDTQTGEAMLLQQLQGPPAYTLTAPVCPDHHPYFRPVVPRMETSQIDHGDHPVQRMDHHQPQLPVCIDIVLILGNVPFQLIT